MSNAVRTPRTTKVKNKTPAAVQITAEQILREAQERQEAEPRPPRQKITDPEELAEYRMRKRKGFEDSIRRQRTMITTWIKYAKWEESQRDFTRARSVFERAIDVDYRNVIVWLKYAEMEMSQKFINHARNVWDRAVTLLPRCDQLWYKYALMEDMLGNFAGARQIFERWMEWQPDEHAWNSYIKFELRNGEIERVYSIYQRLVACHPTVRSWLKWSKFEEKQGHIDRAREVYQNAMEALGEESNDERLFIAYAKLEERAKEHERARTIYKYALDHIPKRMAQELYKMWISFEKQNGDRLGIEDVIIGKRRFQYEEEIKNNPHNYDVWFDYIRLEEANGDIEQARQVFERAIANIPPAKEKRYWRRYIYLWINYALYEELEAKDFEKAREVYRSCLKQIPHKEFSFAKLWILFAQFEIRQQNLDAARSIFGCALGMAEHEKIYRKYIDLEFKLGNMDRCRLLYQKFLESDPANCQGWCRFAELERSLKEIERARAIYELAVEQLVLDMPEIVWKAYIDFEIEQEEYDNTRALYRRLLQRTKHVKVWISFAQFESTLNNVDQARNIYEEAYKALGTAESKEERYLLVEKWKEFEENIKDENALSKVMVLFPERIKKRRSIKGDDGSDAGWEEYYDYIFPDEKNALQNMKFLQAAREWEKRKLTGRNEQNTDTTDMEI
eukprot:TRINITY_DN336_c0_g2_i1.p1 TRINITY_DN336_c0_g2~~TRINITY_DN336_c0_g2_i1.p1  ORF type:complete len:676 (-),score=115.55 TRINITY_DN336_c0_g2_i1:129-2156(-)